MHEQASTSHSVTRGMANGVDYNTWRLTGRRVTLAGQEIFVRVSGSGPALLFLHGFPTSSYDFTQVIGALEKEFQCIAFDFAGFGDSEPLAQPDYQQQTNIALALLTHLGIVKTVLVAHDYGVTVAQEMLARKQQGRLSDLAIAGVVLLNGGLDANQIRPLAIQRLLLSPLGLVLGPFLVRRSTFERAMRRILVRFERFDIVQHWQAVTVRGSHQRVHQTIQYMNERRRYRQRWVAALANEKTPLALAWGERDPISGTPMLQWAKGLRPDAQVLALEVGHYPQIEATEEVAAFVERFAADLF